MVKGNWERRAEMVAVRRVEERAQKAQKAAGSKQFATGESVITKLLRDRESLGTVPVVGWIALDQENTVCQYWLRQERCPYKRCKNRHESNVAHLNDLHCPAEGDPATELLCTGPVDIQEIERKDYSKLHFLAVDGACVFDHLYPEVWTKWSEERRALQARLDKSRLSTITEELTLDDKREVGAKGGGDEPSPREGTTAASDGPTPPGTGFGAFFLDPEHQATAPFCNVVYGIFLFLTGAEAGRFAITNKQVYHHCQRTDLFRLRRREGMAVYTAEHSRLKKLDKKKKAKQANTKKESKKDGFARGGNAH